MCKGSRAAWILSGSEEPIAGQVAEGPWSHRVIVKYLRAQNSNDICKAAWMYFREFGELYYIRDTYLK